MERLPSFAPAAKVERPYEPVSLEGLDEPTFAGLSERSQEMLRQEWQVFRAMLQEKVDDPTCYIDKGGAGTVHALGNTGMCVKVSIERRQKPGGPVYNLGNSASVEAEYQRRAAELVLPEGARTPKLFSVREGQPHSIILMEQLDAINLQHIFNRAREFPKEFNDDRFMSALEQYVNAMHKIGIYHGDLYARNVMVDRKTGLPRVIDFGRAGVIQQSAIGKIKEDEDWQRIEEIDRFFTKRL